MHNPTHGLLEIDNCFYEMAEVGAKIKFPNEKKRYTVRASNRFFSVCTKPQNLVTRKGKSGTVEKTVLYTIIDWVHKIRGTENLVFSAGAETDKECEEMLDRLTKNRTQISHRNWVNLDIESYIPPKYENLC